jgi:outer membrane lipoprotein SlyB
MKKAILIAAITLSSATAFCQAKPDTSKKVQFTQNEVNQIQNTLQQAVNKIHTVHIDALKRDSLDNMMGAVYNFINQRETETYHPKPAPKEGGKKTEATNK